MEVGVVHNQCSGNPRIKKSNSKLELFSVGKINPEEENRDRKEIDQRRLLSKNEDWLEKIKKWKNFSNCGK